MLIALTFVHVIKQALQTSGQLTIESDGKSAMEKAFDNGFPGIRDGHFDVIRAIQADRRKCNSIISTIFIRGHQDQLGQPLDRHAQLNVEADRLAGAF